MTVSQHVEARPGPKSNSMSQPNTQPKVQSDTTDPPSVRHYNPTFNPSATPLYVSARQKPHHATSRAMHQVKLDFEDIKKVLVPAPSMSRTGKMANNAMFIASLVQNGLSSFESKQDRSARAAAEMTKGKKGIPVLHPDSVDLDLEDLLPTNEKSVVSQSKSSLRIGQNDHNQGQNNSESFGFSGISSGEDLNVSGIPRTNPILDDSALEHERENDIISSPRVAHAVRLKKERIQQEALTDELLGSVCGKLCSSGLGAKEEHSALEKAPRPTIPGLDLHQARQKAAHTTQSNGTSSFRTFDRFKVPDPNVPPVGHYRPRFHVIEHTPRQAPLRGRDGRVALKSKEMDFANDAHSVPEEENIPSQEKLSTRRESQLEWMDSEVVSERKPTNSIEAPASTPRPTIRELAFTDLTDFSAHASRLCCVAFRSQVPCAANSVVKGTLGTHLEYTASKDNLTAVPPYLGPSRLEIKRMIGRDEAIASTATRSCGPDMAYNVMRDTLVHERVRTIDFSTQISRLQSTIATRSGVVLQGNESYRLRPVNPVNCPHGQEYYPLDYLDKIKYPNTARNISFEKQTHRKSLTEGLSNVEPQDHMLDVFNTQQQVTRKPLKTHRALHFEHYVRSPAMKERDETLRSSECRPPVVLPKEEIHLNDVRHTFTTLRSRSTIIDQNVHGHQGFIKPSICQKDHYDVSLRASRSKISAPVDLSRSIGRDVPPISRNLPSQQEESNTMDKYDVKTADSLRHTRVKGDPLMGTHLSREQKDHALRLRIATTDQFYDPDYRVVRSTIPSKLVNIHKMVTRDEFFATSRIGNNPHTKVGEKWARQTPGPGTYTLPNIEKLTPRPPAVKFTTSKAR